MRRHEPKERALGLARAATDWLQQPIVIGTHAQATPQEWADLGLPRAFGSYLLLDRIGRGGMAEIFLARATNDLGVARRVVVKLIAAEYSSDPVFTRALISEAKLAAQLSHTNIVRVLDLGREDDRLYIAMEYVEGFDLNQLLGRLSRERIPLPLEFALLIVRSLLAALDCAHRAVDADGTLLGVVHRDVSPANVLISLEGEVRLCDFGIARAFAPEASADDEPLFQHAIWAGKGWYVAPEHARGQDVDARSDVFAVGVLLWELCAGRRMYKRDDMSWLDPERAMAIPSLPAREFPESEWLHKILDKALAFDPAMRFQSAYQMLTELEEYALATQLMASQLRFAAFLGMHFEAAFAELRRLREQAADRALEAWSEEANAEESGESGSRRLPLPVPVPVRRRNHAPAQAPLRLQHFTAPDAVAADASDPLPADEVSSSAFRAKNEKLIYLAISAVVVALLAYWLATH